MYPGESVSVQVSEKTTERNATKLPTRNLVPASVEFLTPILTKRIITRLIFVFRKRNQLPPQDSAIMLGPGEAVHIDAEVQQSLDKLRRNFREVRGNVLAGCFEIEYQLDVVLCEVLFPGSDNPNLKGTDNVPMTVESAKTLRGLFDELILKGGGLSMISFAFKIDLFNRLSVKIPAVHTCAPKGIGKQLDAVRKIRNRFAHYPITFKPVGNPPNQTFAPLLVCGDRMIELDTAFFVKYQKLFGSVIIGLQEILKALTGNMNRA
jgi:hypothetical protein